MNTNNRLVRKVSLTAINLAALAMSFVPASLVFSTPVYAASKLEITNVVDKSQSDRGDTLSYTITIKNTGDQTTSNTYLQINSLNLASYVSGSGTYTRTATNFTNSLDNGWVANGANFGNVPAGSDVIVKFQTKVASNANDGDIVWVVAGVKSDQTPTPVVSSAGTKVLLANPSLCAKKEADKSVVSPGETVTYTITFCNNGNIVLNNVRLFDELPSQVTYVAGSTTYTRGTFSTAVTDAWVTDGVNLGDLSSENDGVFKFRVKVKDNVTDGAVIRNVAKIKSDQTVWVDCDNKITVRVSEKEEGFIKIFKFEDFNGNGKMDGKDKALPNFKFRIVGEGLDFTAITGAGGIWISGSLPVGTYTVTEIVPKNWTITTSNNVKVVVTEGDISLVKFGNKEKGKVLELPNTGPEASLMLLLGTLPAGWFLRRLKRKI